MGDFGMVQRRNSTRFLLKAPQPPLGPFRELGSRAVGSLDRLKESLKLWLGLSVEDGPALRMLQRPSFRRGRSEQSSGNAQDSGGRFRHRQSKRGGSGDGFSPEGSLLFSRDDSLRSRWRQALLFQASQIRKLAELCLTESLDLSSAMSPTLQARIRTSGVESRLAQAGILLDERPAQYTFHRSRGCSFVGGHANDDNRLPEGRPIIMRIRQLAWRGDSRTRRLMVCAS